MLCKECWIYRQKLEGTEERLSNLTIDTAQFLGERINNPDTAARFKESTDKVYDYLYDLRRKLIVEIADIECPKGACILVGGKNG
jgi:hypothetical protein